jgi:predicted phosphodiesterase
MAVFDEAPECLHPLPQYLGGHGYRFVTVHNFARQELAAAKNQDPTIDWKIVYILPQADIHVSATNHGPESAMQRNFHPLFDQYGVDLVLYGHNHNHNYMKTYTL